MNRWLPATAGLVALGAIAAWVLLRSAPEPDAAAPPSRGVPAAAEAPAQASAPTEAARRTAPAQGGTELNRQAVNAWMTGDVETAMALFERAIAASPDDPEPHGNYGRLLTLMVSYDRAIPLLERARDLSPQDPQAWLDLATVYERAQRLDDSWAARAEAEKLVGAGAITRDEQGRFIVVGTSLW